MTIKLLMMAVMYFAFVLGPRAFSALGVVDRELL